MYKSLRGTRDRIGKEAEEFHLIEEKARKLFQTFAFREVRTPLIEETGLFVRSIGESTDIVEKEMFSFQDKKGRNISLRPEGTAPVVRAYLEKEIYKQESMSRFYYIGSFYRYERPQAGREREFHQVGVEVLGSSHPATDAEIIYLGYLFLRSLGIKNFKIWLGSVGCRKDRESFKEKILKILRSKENLLCKDCRRRMKVNPLRVFDCKVKECQKVVSSLPSLLDSLCEDCRLHLEEVKGFLKELAVPFQLHPSLVRGLDYYTRTTFEMEFPLLGAQKTLLAGGRYDHLVEELGGPSIPACGFAAGVERLIVAREKEGRIELPSFSRPLVYLCYVDKKFFREVFLLTQELREKGISSEMDYLGRSLKAQLRNAHRLGVKYSLIIGEEESEKGVVKVKDMEAGKEEEVKRERIEKFLRERLSHVL